MTRRRREKPTVPAPAPTMAELAAEAHARLNPTGEPYRLGEGEKASAAFAPRLCGPCQPLAGGRPHPRYPGRAPCSFYACECPCRHERSHDVTQPIAALEPPCDQGCGHPMSEHFYTGTPNLCPTDPRDGSGVRDAVSQDPALAGLLEGL